MAPISMGAAALRLAGLGFEIFPLHTIKDGKCTCGRRDCSSPGKHPISSLTPNGVLQATKDVLTIQAWWNQRPDANIGVATGRRSNIWVLDLDEKPGQSGTESLYNIMGEHEEIPSTISVVTGSGGRHIYFAYPKDADIGNRTNLFGKEYPGVDVRGDGGYVVAPPSIHASGRRYEYEVDRSFGDHIKIKRAPAWLIEKIKANKTNIDGDFRVATYGAKIAAGSRNDTLFRAGAALRNFFGVSERGMVNLLLALNEDLCETPLPRDEVITLAKSAMKLERHQTKLAEAIFADDMPEDPETDIVDEDTGEKITYELTDLGHAKRAIDVLGGGIVFVQELGGWFKFDGRVWQPAGSEDAEVAAAVEKVAQRFKIRSESLFKRAKESDDTEVSARLEKKAKVYHAQYLNLQQTKHVSNVIKAVRRKVTMGSGEFDKDASIIAVENGVVDLSTREIREFDIEDYMTKICSGVRYDPSAQAYEWHKFLDRIFLSKKEVISFVQRMMGYCLSGFTTEQAFFFFYGGGANGKSTLLNAIRHIIGPYCKSIPAAELMRGNKSPIRHNIARLVGARVVIASEIQQSSRLDESMIKDLTGGDRIIADLKNRDSFEFQPQFKLIMYGNHQPSVEGTDNGIWRRMCMIPFDASITKEERDPFLGDKLAAESSGILNWLLKGYDEWATQGLNPPESILAATEEYRSAEDIFGGWIEECCSVNRLDDKHTCRNSVLYASYVTWCEDKNIKPVNGIRFGKELGKRGFKDWRSGGVRGRYWIKVTDEAYVAHRMQERQLPYKDDDED